MKLVDQQRIPEAMAVVTSPILGPSSESLDSSLIEGIGLFDVLCGRDRNAFNNVGNRRFRVSVSIALDRYLKASTRKEKSIVIRSVVEVVRRNGGRFLQESSVDGTKRYIELDEKRSHEKTGHALRDMALLRGTKSKKSSSMQSICSSTANSTLSSVASKVAGTRNKLKPSPTTVISEFVLSHHVDQEPLMYPLPRFPAAESGMGEDNWDDASDLSSDESVFDDLVRLVAGTSDASKNDANKFVSSSGITDLHVYSDDAVIYNTELNDDSAVLHSNALHLDQINDKRMSSTSFVVDDHMLSWLVGEIDFV